MGKKSLKALKNTKLTAKKFKLLFSSFKNFTDKEKNTVKRNLSLDLVKLLTEIVKNICNGNIKVNAKAKSALSSIKLKCNRC